MDVSQVEPDGSDEATRAIGEGHVGAPCPPLAADPMNADPGTTRAAERFTTRPLRFAMVTTFYPPFNFGGDGYYVRRLAHALARRGHTVDVIHNADAYRLLTRGGDPEPIAEPTGVTVHTLRSRTPALSCLASHQLGRPLVHGARIRKILAQGFDVIHFHNVSLVGGPGVLSYGTGVKLYTAHEHWLVCPMHTLWRHARELCTGRQCLRCALAYRRPPQLWRAGDLLARQARHIDAFIALSRFTADKHAEFGFPAPMTVMPSFLPDAPAARTPSPAAGGRPYFLFVGRLERIKGLQDVIPVFGEASPADLVIAGAGTYEPALRALAGGRPNVRFLGEQTPDQLGVLYRGARALITPSVCYEVFPLVVLEAFQQGIPIIARRLGPYPEIVEASGGGVLFTDRAELDAAIRSLASDHARRNAMAKAAQRAFGANWSEPVALTAYFGLIGAIARRRRLDAVARAFPAPEGC
jgi:glycosyltransferase involved in cell wall biosynthesis